MGLRPALQCCFRGQVWIRQSCERFTGPAAPVAVSDAGLANSLAVTASALAQQKTRVAPAMAAFSGLLVSIYACHHDVLRIYRVFVR